ncbi:MAG: phosphate ABC transporter substrate-binding protein, PhoT family [Bacteroidetes bacterium]|nr:phosphate ABC transporter substrate-binding protein, PhoT family [Bacteroidota bacterium]
MNSAGYTAGDRLPWLACFLLLLSACKSYDKQRDELPDNKYKGTIRVSADESFKPIIDEHIKIYESQHSGASIRVEYKPEADCLRDLPNDSVRMVIATRPASEEEKEYISDSLKKNLRSMTVANDAIAVIVHPSSPDSLFTMQELREILTGKFKKNLIPVFDGVKATSTVRFIIDSVLRGDSLTPKAMAARSSEGVIDYVSKNPNVIGFIGISWIGNPEDTAQMSFLKKVRMAALESSDKPGAYVKAYQANIYLKRYPMVRDLVYILKENYRGLGTAFANFMSGETGQIIFRRAYLVPTKKKFGIRPVKLKE